MRDNELIRVFLPILQEQLPLYGYPGVIVKQTNQPTQQGVNTTPTLYFYKIDDHRYGTVRRSDNFDEIEMIETHTEEQWYETKFRFQSLVLQKPSKPYGYTASDLVNDTAAILQSSSTLKTLLENQVSILRIQDLTNPYFSDDRDQYEASPSFDVIFTHKQIRVITIPVIESTTYTIIGV